MSNLSQPICEVMMGASGFELLKPTERHLGILARISTEANVRGPLFSDACLAALAIRHGAALATSDRDLRRLDGLKTINPVRA